MQSISHLNPPFQLSPLALCRSAVYFDEAESYEIKLLDPDPMDDPIYYLAQSIDKKIAIRDLAGKLEAQYHTIDQTVINRCKDLLTDWKANFPINKGKLYYRRGPRFLDICDQRTGLPQEIYTLGETEGKIYLACDAPQTVEEVWKNLDNEEQSELSKREVKQFLDMLTENRLVYREEGKYLSLAIHQN
jgi:hypothetical protein